MAETLKAHLYSPTQAREPFVRAWELAKAMLMAGHRLTLEIKPEKRSDAQNRRLWAMLTDISRAVDWYGQKLTAEEWKHVFSAALAKQKVVPGLDGGFVVLGQSTSKMTKAEMSEMQELMMAFGVERGVQFSDGCDE
jgi:hypothetical protein